MTSFGHPRRHLATADSTNERARELAIEGAPSGTVVTAGLQTAGRGRRGRTWSAPAGKALLCSAILAPLELEHAMLPLAVPLAVCEAAESLAPLECLVKWPNDVWVSELKAAQGDGEAGKAGPGPSTRADVFGRKLAGVLIEAEPPAWAVIGIGLNVSIEPAEFPDDLRQPATSIGHGVGVEDALGAVCERLGGWVAADATLVLAEFARRDALAGHRVSWAGAGGASADGTGVAEGIDERGNLVVVADGGERLSLGAGEIQLVGHA
ncbi:MAG TPA: biotin--[acetyl-CoA-carboxylase] ligase [Solirubrobacterales bacterium]